PPRLGRRRRDNANHAPRTSRTRLLRPTCISPSSHPHQKAPPPPRSIDHKFITQQVLTQKPHCNPPHPQICYPSQPFSHPPCASGPAGSQAPSPMHRPIRNIAIIAHVDHGKTTLVDCLLKQSGTFAAHEKVAERVMDSNDIERE